MNYFDRKFKTLRGVKIAIFFKRPYDWIRLKWKGDIILSQKYGIQSCFMIHLGGKDKNRKGKRYYRIMNMIWTQQMLDALNQHVQYHVEIKK